MQKEQMSLEVPQKVKNIHYMIQQFHLLEYIQSIEGRVSKEEIFVHPCS